MRSSPRSRIAIRAGAILCKAGDCNSISKDVIAYRATEDNIGAWAVDIIGNHCALPPDKSTSIWLVLGFDPLAVWRAARQ